MFGWLKSSRSDAAKGATPEKPCADAVREGDEHKGRGDKYFHDGEMARAEECYRQALAVNPAFAEAFNALGNSLCLQGRYGEAMSSYQNALKLKPDYAGAYNNLGNLFHNQGRLDDAIAAYRSALALNPEFSAEVLNNIGSVLYEQNNLADAATYYRKAIELKPEYTDAHTNLGIALNYMGQVEGALESYRIHLSAHPDDAESHSNLLFMMQYFEKFSPEALLAEHRRFARQFEEPLKAQWAAHSNPPDPERRLRIGYVSPDFRDHAVAYFIEPVLEQHDKSAVEVFCYYNHAQQDAFTERIRRASDHWIPCVGVSDAALAGKIRADAIDVLVDLTGHTARNRMLTFARKPAPVQVTYLGYPGTTGLSAVDYRLSDRIADPPETSAPLHVEKLWYLPETNWCYRPQQDGPDGPRRLPLEENGYATFGCFNNFAKVTDRVIAVWGRLLQSAPLSRFLLKVRGIENRAYRAGIEERLARLGVPVERVTLIGHQKEHPYSLYNRIDVALDPFPYNGCTTSFDTLWMGVPFVTLAGQTSASRVGVSILTNSGLPDLIAESEDDYIRIAGSLARDPDRLRKLRAGLRETLLKSALMDARRMAAGVEQAYRGMWREWCSTHQSKR